MKAYRLHNRTEHSPASPLHFLNKADADRYRDAFRWPYENTGSYPLPSGGAIPLSQLDLRSEEVEFKATVIPELDLLLLERDGVIGSCYLLPGDCFNPDDWGPPNLAELGLAAGPLIEAAKKNLK